MVGVYGVVRQRILQFVVSDVVVDMHEHQLVEPLLVEPQQVLDTLFGLELEPGGLVELLVEDELVVFVDEQRDFLAQLIPAHDVGAFLPPVDIQYSLDLVVAAHRYHEVFDALEVEGVRPDVGEVQLDAVSHQILLVFGLLLPLKLLGGYRWSRGRSLQLCHLYVLNLHIRVVNLLGRLLRLRGFVLVLHFHHFYHWGLWNGSHSRGGGCCWFLSLRLKGRR